MMNMLEDSLRCTDNEHMHETHLRCIFTKLRAMKMSPDIKYAYLCQTCTATIWQATLVRTAASLHCSGQTPSITWLYTRGSQHGVHVSLRIHLPIWWGTFNVRTTREKYIHMLFICIKKSEDFCCFTQSFCHKKF